MVARDTTMCSEEPTHPGERVDREQRSDLSLRRGLGLEECIPDVFTAIALALTDSQQNEVSSSPGASAGDSKFCSQQWGWRELWNLNQLRGHCENPL